MFIIIDQLIIFTRVIKITIFRTSLLLSICKRIFLVCIHAIFTKLGKTHHAISIVVVAVLLNLHPYTTVPQLPTLKCLSIGTPNTTTSPLVPDRKWWLLGVPTFEHIIIKL